MKKRLLLSLLFSALFFSLIAEVSGTIYSAHAQCTWTVPHLHLDVAVDTGTDTITFIWEGFDILIFPVPALRCLTTPYWHVYDGKGYDKWSECCLPHSGSETLEGYTHGETWLTVEVTWSFGNGFIFITIPLKTNIYIGERPIRYYPRWSCKGHCLLM